MRTTKLISLSLSAVLPADSSRRIGEGLRDRRRRDVPGRASCPGVRARRARTGGRHRGRRAAAPRVGLPGDGGSGAHLRLALADVPRRAVALYARADAGKTPGDRPVRLGMGRHRLRSVRSVGGKPLGRTEPDQVLEATGEAPAPGHAHLHLRRLLHPGPGRAGRDGGPDHLPVGRRRRRHGRSVVAHRQMEPVGSAGGALRRLGDLPSGHGPRSEHVRAQRRGRHRRVAIQHRVLWGHRQPIPTARPRG